MMLVELPPHDLVLLWIYSFDFFVLFHVYIFRKKSLHDDVKLKTLMYFNVCHLGYMMSGQQNMFVKSFSAPINFWNFQKLSINPGYWAPQISTFSHVYLQITLRISTLEPLGLLIHNPRISTSSNGCFHSFKTQLENILTVSTPFCWTWAQFK